MDVDKLKESIKITIGQFGHPDEFETWYDRSNRYRIKGPDKHLDYFFNAVKTAKRDKTDFLVFPELFLPRAYLNTYVKSVCAENRFIIIGGLEYGPAAVDASQKEIPVTNEAFIAFPPQMGYHTPKVDSREKQATVMVIPKIMPAESEESMLVEANYRFRYGNKIYLFESESLGNWAVLICADFLNLPVHALLQSKIQTLFVVAYNTDVNGYASIADCLQRLLMCNVVICNSGYYGSSLCYSPYREPYKREVMRVIGNHIDAAITIQMPIRKLVKAQCGMNVNIKVEQKQEFIRRPPDFGRRDL